MKQLKIAIVGAGNVGSTIAYTLMLRNTDTEILLVDIDTVRCRGEILDLSMPELFHQPHHHNKQPQIKHAMQNHHHSCCNSTKTWSTTHSALGN